MILDYATLLSPTPIKLRIGTIRKPTLREIAEIGFDTLGLYEYFMKLTPSKYHTDIKKDELTSADETLFSLIVTDEGLREIYQKMFSFFIVEPVVWRGDMFVIFKQGTDTKAELNKDNISGVVFEDNIEELLEVFQQVCCIYEEEKPKEELKFKNKKAKELYERMQEAEAESKKATDKNFSTANIISAVSNRHPTINPISVWDLTQYQLIDAFNRLRTNEIYDIDAKRVSTWGDEKRTFDISLWYKNYVK